MKSSEIVLVAVMAVGFSALIVSNSARVAAESKLRVARHEIEVKEIAGYERGLAAGINATLATVKLNGTNKPSIDLADTLEYARTNKSR